MANSSKTNPPNPNGDVFDVRKVRRLVELMQENELTELDIQQGDMRIQLKRGYTGMVPAAPVFQQSVAAHPVFSPASPASPAVPVAAAPAGVQSVSVEEKNVHIIKSPMVGTFYASPNPESPSFVKVGDSVSLEKTVCLIEAMKVFNEIQAECSGKIVAVLAKNGEMVEFGTPLFKVSMD